MIMGLIKSGRLEVVTGGMFSGKTEELIRRLERVRIAHKEVVIFKPRIDNHYSEQAIMTHYGREFIAHPLASGSESFFVLESIAGVDAIEFATVVAFDEAQFFSDKLPGLCEELVRKGKRVIVAGLDLTFARQPFGSMPALMALANDVDKLHAVCVKCGGEATCSQRLINGKPASANDEVVVVGGEELYQALCLDCYEKG